MKVLIISIATILVVTIGYVISGSIGIQQQTAVRYGYLPLSSSLALFVAQDQGFFEDEEVEVELIRFESSNVMAEALLAGNIDAEISASSFVIAALAPTESDKLDVFMVNSFDRDNYITSLIVKVDSEIDEVGDLRSKRIGCFPGSTARTYTRIFLEREGAYDENTEIVELTPDLQLQSLDAGSIDALFTYEPVATIGVSSGLAKVIQKAPIESGVLDPWVAGTASFNSSFLNNRAEEADGVQKALFRAVDLMRNDPSAAKKSLPKYTSIQDAAIVETIPIPNTLKTREIDVVDFQMMVDLLFEEGILQEWVDIRQVLL